MATSRIRSLQRLDELLAQAPKSAPEPFGKELAGSAEYSKAHAYIISRVDSRCVVEAGYLAEKAKEAIKSGGVSVFRLCSVGCGEGKLDRLLLERLTSAFPEVEFHYFGCDINEVACVKARGALKSLPLQVHCSVACYDFEKLGKYFTDGKFDFVITTHTLYHTSLSNLPSILSNLLGLVALNGSLVITICRESDCNELIRRFWLHENKRPMLFMPDVTKTLQAMGVKYTHDKLDSVRNLSECFEDNFTSDLSKAALDFMTHTNLASYPHEVHDTCVQFLRTISSEDFTIPFPGEAVNIVQQ